MRVNCKRVLAAWQAGRKDQREQSVWTDGEHIYSYGTCIVATLPANAPEWWVVLNVTRYSVTTTVHQNALRVALAGLIACEVDGVPSCASAQSLIDKSRTLEAAAQHAAKVLGIS